MANKGPVELPWHADFRDAGTLPDIKPVRSVFFINFVPMALSICLLFYWIFIEWQHGALNSAIATHEKAIATHEKVNEQLLGQSEEFERVAKNISQIQGFVGVPFKPSQFLVSIGAVRPAQMLLTQISYAIESRTEPAPKVKEGEKKPTPKSFAVYNITISGSVAGTSQQATKSVEAFRDKMETLDLFKTLKMHRAPIIKTFTREKSIEVYNFTLTTEVRL